MAAKVKSKAETPVAAPLEMVPAPVVNLEIDGSNIGAFRAFGKANQKVLAFNNRATKSTAELYDVIDSVVKWLVTYANADEAELDKLNFTGLSQVWQQAGAAYSDTDIPQKKSAP